MMKLIKIKAKTEHRNNNDLNNKLIRHIINIK